MTSRTKTVNTTVEGTTSVEETTIIETTSAWDWVPLTVGCYIAKGPEIMEFLSDRFDDFLDWRPHWWPRHLEVISRAPLRS